MSSAVLIGGDDEDEPLTVGALYEMVPATGEWLVLPEYGLRVRRWSPEPPEFPSTGEAN